MASSVTDIANALQPVGQLTAQSLTLIGSLGTRQFRIRHSPLLDRPSRRDSGERSHQHAHKLRIVHRTAQHPIPSSKTQLGEYVITIRLIPVPRMPLIRTPLPLPVQRADTRCLQIVPISGVDKVSYTPYRIHGTRPDPIGEPIDLLGRKPFTDHPVDGVPHENLHIRDMPHNRGRCLHVPPIQLRGIPLHALRIQIRMACGHILTVRAEPRFAQESR